MQAGHAPLDVVISYSRTDSDFVDRLEADLKAHDLTTWVDRRKLEGGQVWEADIRSAIDSCRILLVVISPDALASVWVRQEYRYALKQHKEVIPIRYHPTATLPPELQKLQWIDFLLTMNFEATYQAHLEELLKAIEFHLERSHAREAARAETQAKLATGTRRRLVVRSLALAALVLVLLSGVIAHTFFREQLVAMVPVLQHVPGFASTPTPTPSAPQTIVLTLPDAPSVPGDHYILTAVADRPVDNTGYVIQLVDLTDGSTVVHQCSTGSSCSVQLTCPQGGSSTQYAAYVDQHDSILDAYAYSLPVTVSCPASLVQ